MELVLKLEGTLFPTLMKFVLATKSGPNIRHGEK